ncbi:hypothetical protein ACFPK9_10925 [Rubritalea spongiae]|uniref:Tetratricopeptide repeat protein n=1 Tax=Rubritalea spongiae TaxID=430797 RepID=A0ABW5DYJ1_9BACT
MKLRLSILTISVSTLIVPLSAATETHQLVSTPQSANKNSTYLNWHNLCLNADTDTIDTQIKKFESQIAIHPNDNLAKAYLGSAYALRAKSSTWWLTKLKYLNKGKATMNAAIAAAPNDPRVRMVRAIAYYKVPKRFDLRPTSISDFKQIIPVALKNASPLAINERQAILYYAYLAYEDENLKGAETFKQACYKLNSSSKYGKLTRP